MFGAEVSLGRLNRSVAKEQLDLLKLAACGPTQFGARPTKVMGRDAREAHSFRVPLEHLPHRLLAHTLARHPVSPIHWPEEMPDSTHPRLRSTDPS